MDADVNIDPMPSSWSKPGLRTKPRQSDGDMRSKKRRNRPGRRDDEDWCRREMNKDERRGGVGPLGPITLSSSS